MFVRRVFPPEVESGVQHLNVTGQREFPFSLVHAGLYNAGLLAGDLRDMRAMSHKVLVRQLGAMGTSPEGKTLCPWA